MKKLLILIAAVVLLGCGEPQQSTPTTETKPVDPGAEVPEQLLSPLKLKPIETVTEVTRLEPPTPKTPDILIQEAAFHGDIEAVKQHLASGANVNLKNDGGSTPLIEASRKGHKQIAKLLIENGADVNCKLEYTTDIESIEGWTSLHVAAAKGHKVIAELLIIKGADVNAMDDTRRSPLDWAQIIRVQHSKKIKESKKEIADLLRKHGGKPGYEL